MEKTWIISILAFTYVLCVVIFFFTIFRDQFKNKEFKNEGWGFKLFVLILLFFPIVNQILAYVLLRTLIFQYLKSFFVKGKEKYKAYKKNKEKLSERKRKIKLGIIRITKNDPYGEEDWSDSIYG
jgi:hypothetical protein